MAETLVRCAECGVTSAGDATGWRGVLAVGDEDNEEELETAVWCPDCAAREFEV